MRLTGSEFHGSNCRRYFLAPKHWLLSTISAASNADMSHSTVETAAGAAAVLREELASAVTRQQQQQTPVPPVACSTPTTTITTSTTTASKQLDEIAARLSNTEVVLSSLLAGATAGAAAKTTIAPLDRTKINFQIRESPYTAKEALKFLIHTYKTEGLLSLWRGNSATMARIVPYAAIQFAAHEQWKRVLKVDMEKSTRSHPLKRLMAGALAGVTSQSLTYPLDLARARMAVTQKEKYRTLRQVFVKIWREEGPRTFYRGYIPTVLGVIPYAGVSFFTYDTLKRSYMDYYGSSSPNVFVSLVFGATAGVLSQTSSYPLDIVRRRMQTSPLSNPHYKTILGTFRKIYRDEGIRKGFFKGLSMNWIKGPVAVGISFATYDTAKDFLRRLMLLRH